MRRRPRTPSALLRLPLAVLALLVVALLVGCGEAENDTPVACLNGEVAYLKALGAAPAEVRIAGEARISECLAENQDAGELATVGTALVGAATALNAEAREAPKGDAALRLGYLVGAAQRGAEDTEGIHTDLLRRLVVAAKYAPAREPLPADFAKAYTEGFDAGRTDD